MNYNPKYFSL